MGPCNFYILYALYDAGQRVSDEKCVCRYMQLNLEMDMKNNTKESPIIVKI